MPICFSNNARSVIEVLKSGVNVDVNKFSIAVADVKDNFKCGGAQILQPNSFEVTQNELCDIIKGASTIAIRVAGDANARRNQIFVHEGGDAFIRKLCKTFTMEVLGTNISDLTIEQIDKIKERLSTAATSTEFVFVIDETSVSQDVVNACVEGAQDVVRAHDPLSTVTGSTYSTEALEPAAKQPRTP